MFSSLIPPLKVASDSWVCVKGGVSAFPACPPSGVRGLTQ
ncbi:hypothetical protein HMPREF9072_02049 [Capnocytophaga sp. oral taxon 324 str. F0483]|nr:hypothetical protein HMPREF9072_02049 [Capnocytophaga sp. oral taxon 324 str. F0483]